jgi:adenylate cyclase, class 2
MPLLEIESKYRVDDHEPYRKRLAERGAKLIESREDADRYFNAPDRDFARTDEAFRVRRIGERNLLTYKGPKRDALTKTRAEIEVPFADGSASADDLERLLQHLGYRPVTVVRKKRSVYELTRAGYAVHVCLDDVAEVGTFVEVEIVAEESEFEPGRAALLQLADELGLKDSERRSYLALLLERRAGQFDAGVDTLAY